MSYHYTKIPQYYKNINNNKPIPMRIVSDYGYYYRSKYLNSDVFITYTIRHKIRLWFGQHGTGQDGSVSFWHIRYNSFAHKVLNHFLRRRFELGRVKVKDIKYKTLHRIIDFLAEKQTNAFYKKLGSPEWEDLCKGPKGNIQLKPITGWEKRRYKVINYL